MPKLAKAGNQNIAKDALEREVDSLQVGDFIEAIHDDAFVTSYLFESKLKGYQGWRWSVTLTQVDAKHAPTVSEIVLLSGPDSIVAPNWVPWSERLADYRALQAALEEQAKLAAEEADDADSEDESDGVNQAENSRVDAVDAAEDAQPKAGRSRKSATAKVDQHSQAEGQADDAAADPPKRLRWLTRKKRH